MSSAVVDNMADPTTTRPTHQEVCSNYPCQNESHSTLFCADCKDGINKKRDSNPVAYCSAACMKAHSSAHKAACANRMERKQAQVLTQLHRGSALLQEVFYAFREATFDHAIMKIEKKDDKLHIHAGPSSYGDPPLYAFPLKMVKGDADKYAVLTRRACNDGPAYMFELTKKVFEGTGGAISEVGVSVDASFERTVYYEHNVPITGAFRHELLLVTLKNAEVFVVDLTGAQYGILQAITPHAEYKQKYVTVVYNTETHGYQKKLVNIERSPDPLDDPRVHPVMRRVTGHLDQTIANWEQSSGKSVAEMLRLTCPVYEAMKQDFMGKVKTALAEYIEKHAADIQTGFGKLPDGFNLRVAHPGSQGGVSGSRPLGPKFTTQAHAMPFLKNVTSSGRVVYDLSHLELGS